MYECFVLHQSYTRHYGTKGCVFFNLLHKEEDDDEEEIDPNEPAIFGSVECVNSVTALKTFSFYPACLFPQNVLFHNSGKMKKLLKTTTTASTSRYLRKKQKHCNHASYQINQSCSELTSSSGKIPGMPSHCNKAITRPTTPR